MARVRVVPSEKSDGIWHITLPYADYLGINRLCWTKCLFETIFVIKQLRRAFVARANLELSTTCWQSVTFAYMCVFNTVLAGPESWYILYCVPLHHPLLAVVSLSLHLVRFVLIVIVNVWLHAQEGRFTYRKDLTPTVHWSKHVGH